MEPVFAAADIGRNSRKIRMPSGEAIAVRAESIFDYADSGLPLVLSYEGKQAAFTAESIRAVAERCNRSALAYTALSGPTMGLHFVWRGGRADLESDAVGPLSLRGVVAVSLDPPQPAKPRPAEVEILRPEPPPGPRYRAKKQPAKAEVAMIEASFVRLYSGEWGLRASDTARPGDRVRAVRRDRTAETMVLGPMVWARDGAAIFEIDRATESGVANQSIAPAASNRQHDTRPPPHECGACAEPRPKRRRSA